MRSALICFALLLASVAQGAGIAADARTQSQLEGLWRTEGDPQDGDGRDGVDYEFEFTRSGGIVRYADSIDIDEWRKILSVKRNGQFLSVRMRDEKGHIWSQRFRLSPPDILLELADRDGDHFATLKRQPKVENAGHALRLSTVQFLSRTPPHFARFTHNPSARSAGEACNKLSGKSYVEFNFMAPSGSWVWYQHTPGRQDWTVVAAKEDPKTRTVALQLEVPAFGGATATHGSIHVERLAKDRIRVPEWNEEFFRCTAQNSRRPK